MTHSEGDSTSGYASVLKERLLALGFEERLVPRAVATFRTAERAQRWLDAFGPLALRSEYLHEIAASGLDPGDYTLWRGLGFPELRALRTPRLLRPAALGLEHYKRWLSTGLRSDLEKFVPYLKSDLTFDELLSILAGWTAAGEPGDCNPGSELLEMFKGGLAIDELRSLLESGLSGRQVYAWRSSEIPAADWSTWMQLDFPPEEAAGFFAGEVPAREAKSWSDAGFSAAESLNYIRQHIPLSTAREWTGAGVSARDAIPFIGDSVPLATARQWLDAGLSAYDAVDYLEKEVPLAEAIEFDGRGIGSGQVTRTEDGLELDLDPWQEDPVEQLPQVIEPGPIQMTLWTSALGGDPVAHEIDFTWDGDCTVEWYEDISTTMDLSPMSSSPARGVASWPDGRDVLLTFTWDDFGLRGHDRLPGAAPTHGAEDPQQAVRNPRNWVVFGDTLLDFVLLDLGSRGSEDDQLPADVYDSQEKVYLDVDGLFRCYLSDDDLRVHFDDWVSQRIASGRFEVLDDE